METASFAGFVKILLYIVVFYYVFKILARLFLPMLIKKAVQKAGENFQQQQRYAHTQNRSVNDEILYNSTKTDKPKETKKVGEYVDYEELDS